MFAADTYTAFFDKSALALNPDNNIVLLHPRHDSIHYQSNQKIALLIYDPGDSKKQTRNIHAVYYLKFHRFPPHPSGKLSSEPCHVIWYSTHFRQPNNPHEPCPIDAQSNKDPTFSSLCYRCEDLIVPVRLLDWT